MFWQQIIEELLSVAHVQAVAARAGVSISNFDRDFGIDGTFRQITAKSVRIRISRAQELHPESLLMLMTSAREYAIGGEWIC